MLKPGGLLLAPTFVHGEGGFRLRTKTLELAGFRTYHKWNAQAYVDFVSQHGFSVMKQVVLGSKIAPRCYLEAQRMDLVSN